MSFFLLILLLLGPAKTRSLYRLAHNARNGFRNLYPISSAWKFWRGVSRLEMLSLQQFFPLQDNQCSDSYASHSATPPPQFLIIS